MTTASSQFSRCLGDIEFIAVNLAASQPVAKDFCVEQGATLARISNLDEHEFVGEFLDSINAIPSDASFWIGM